MLTNIVKRSLLGGSAALALLLGASVELQAQATPVVVTNTADKPVLVKEVDSASRNAWTYTKPLYFSVNVANLDGGFYTVPAGKVLVIENVAARCSSTADGHQFGLMLKVTPGAAEFPRNFMYPVNKVGAALYGTYYNTLNQPARINVGESQQVSLQMTRTTLATAVCDVTLDGYLMDKK